MNITIVTPWVDARELVPGYLDALHALQPGDRVIVIDNGSRPKLVIPGVKIIRWPRNYGFSPACNEGLRRAETTAVLFLNNDVRATGTGWLERIREQLAPFKLVGAQLRNDPHSAVDGIPVPYLDGWCLAGLTEDLRMLGGWDEDLQEPSYYGDNLLCAKARAQGFELTQVETGLVHLSNYTSKRMSVAAVTDQNRLVYEQRVRELRAA